MRMRLFAVILFACALCASAGKPRSNRVDGKAQFDVDKQLEYCNAQVYRALKLLQQKDGTYNYSMEPRNILSTDKQKGWNCRPATPEEWCSGFWPGILWMDYSLSGDSTVRKAAEGYTDALHDIAFRPIFDHDIGFLMFCSYGKGYYALQGRAQDPTLQEQEVEGEYKKVLLASADSLATLFNPMVGTLLSWPRNVKMFGGHNTIMDNMINLELLFWASRNGGSPLLYDIAVEHAKTTMQNHFRPDGSCYHVAVYDSIDGHFIKGVTHQGYADYSMWARGQAWAVYGYTMVYRFTHNPVFLKFAEKVTDAYLSKLGVKVSGNHQPQTDLIPAWDLDDPATDAPKDASAACVVADALLELCNYVGGDKGQYYHDLAVEMLAQLSTPQYLSGKRNVSFLMHSVGNYPAGSEIDASIIYADYYYLEALLKLKTLKD